LELEPAEFLSGEIKVDESYFAGQRKGKRDCGVARKPLVFGLFKFGGKFCTYDLYLIPKQASYVQI